MKILLDGSHGIGTLGKRSPDGRLREYAWSRDVVKRMTDQLTTFGFDVVNLVPELEDISLKERCRRANQYKDAILVSVHINAAGADGQWHDARGWAVYVSLNASAKSKQLATDMAWAASLKGWTIRKHTKGVDYNTKDLAICRDTKCPAVLVENFFQDNRMECEWLLTEAGKNACAEVMVNGILAYLQKQ